MSYEIHLAQTAKDDLQEIFSYIAFQIPETNSLQNAEQQIQRLLKQIQTLNEFPNRYPVCSNERLHKRKVHLMPVDNYLVHYQVNQKASTVYVARIVSGRRNMDTVSLQ